jgi:hypothetical protein
MVAGEFDITSESRLPIIAKPGADFGRSLDRFMS